MEDRPGDNSELSERASRDRSLNHRLPRRLRESQPRVDAFRNDKGSETVVPDKYSQQLLGKEGASILICSIGENNSTGVANGFLQNLSAYRLDSETRRTMG